MPGPGYAVLFPGQGGQNDRMAALVHEHAPELAEVVSDELGEDPFLRLEEGTRFVQPAVFLASVAGWRAREPWPEGLVGLAGHSLGELAALVAAGALDPVDGARLVVQRASLTAVRAVAVGGGMLALLGVDPDGARTFARECDLEVANYNCPGQTVLSGGQAEMELAEQEAKRLEIKVRRLAVEGPFHSTHMAPAAERFAEVLADVQFRAPAWPVLSSVSARPFEDPRRELAEALVSTVHWHDTTLALNALGAERFVEVPPGKVLIGLVRRTLRRERPKLEAMDRVKA